jgi:hypothetical protein
VVDVVFDYKIGGPVIACVTGAGTAEPVADWLASDCFAVCQDREGRWCLLYRDVEGLLLSRLLGAGDAAGAVEEARAFLGDG